MAKRRKILRAGRLVYAAVYSTVHPSDSPEARAAKTKYSSAARPVSYTHLSAIAASTDIVIPIKLDFYACLLYTSHTGNVQAHGQFSCFRPRKTRSGLGRLQLHSSHYHIRQTKHPEKRVVSDRLRYYVQLHTALRISYFPLFFPLLQLKACVCLDIFHDFVGDFFMGSE